MANAMTYLVQREITKHTQFRIVAVCRPLVKEDRAIVGVGLSVVLPWLNYRASHGLQNDVRSGCALEVTFVFRQVAFLRNTNLCVHLDVY